MDQDDRKSAGDTAHVGASAPDTDAERDLARGVDADPEEVTYDDILAEYDLSGEGPDA